MLGFLIDPPSTGNPAMTKSPPKSPRNKAPAAKPARKIAPRRKSADQRLRILERLITGLSVAHIARVERLTVRRIRQIIADMLERREIDPPAGYAQLQIARLSEAMIVAHTMMREGNLGAVDRLIKLTAELDRYYGFMQVETPATAPRRIAAPRRELTLPEPAHGGTEGEIFLAATS